MLTGAALALSSPHQARAQSPALPLNAPEPALDEVPEVGDTDLRTLSLPGFGAVSLRASLAAMQDNPASSQGLRLWVGRGNVVFLHTDAAQLFGMRTVTARSLSPEAGGQLFGRARAALPFGSHPLLRGESEAGAVPRRGADPTRLPGVQTVFYSLREGDALVVSSDVATPLLQIEEASGPKRPLYVAAIVSVGAGWAIFCPDTFDSERGDGAQFGRTLRTFVPDQSGARWLGLPSRVLGADASPAILSAALQARLGAASQSDGRAALPGFGTAPALAPVQIETGSEAVLPLERGEARAMLSALGTPSAAAMTALLVARMQWQLGQGQVSARALEVASLDPNLAPDVGFLNGCFAAQIAADVSLDAPSRALAFDGAARAFSLMGNSNLGLGGAARQPRGGAGRGTATSIPIAPFVAATWSREFARLAAIFTLAPPQSQFIEGNGASATLRFYPDDPNALAVASLVQSAIRSRSGPRAPHVEVLLLPSPASGAGVRRALGAPSNASLPGGEVVGTTLLLASGGNTDFGLLGNGANAATLVRGLSLANLNAWTDGARPLPAWVVAGVQGSAIGLSAQVSAPETDPALLSSILEGSAPASPGTATALWRFLIDQGGSGVGEELIARLAAGASIDQALQAATGDDTDAFEDAFRRAARV